MEKEAGMAQLFFKKRSSEQKLTKSFLCVHGSKKKSAKVRFLTSLSLGERF